MRTSAKCHPAPPGLIPVGQASRPSSQISIIIAATCSSVSSPEGRPDVSAKECRNKCTTSDGFATTPTPSTKALARRGLAGEAKRLIELDERRRAAIQKAEAALARRNAASKEIGAAKKSNEEATAQKLLAEVAELKTTIPALEAEEKKLSKELEDALAQIPNLPLRRPKCRTART